MKSLEGFALGAPALIGLDIGTTAVKAARIRRKGRHILVTGLAWAALDALEAVSPEGSPVSDKIALAIWRCVKILRNDAAVCSVSGPDVAVRTFEFPALPRKELASAMELEAMQVCPFEISEGAVAYQVLRGPTGRVGKGESAERMVGIFAAAKNTMIRRHKELCEQGKARCVVVDVDGLALLNCLEACNLRNEGEAALVLNIGSACTNVAIISDDGLPFVRDIVYAGDHIVSHICRSTGSPKKTVAAALAGSDADPALLERVQPSLKEACSTLADRVSETMRYYGTRQSGPAVDRIFLCGGLSQSWAVADVLVPMLPGETQLWDPLTILPCTRSVRRNKAAEHGPAFAVALGLALRMLRDVHD